MPRISKNVDVSGTSCKCVYVDKYLFPGVNLQSCVSAAYFVVFLLTTFHFDAVRGSRCNSSCRVWNIERGNSTVSCPHLTLLCVCVCVYASVCVCMHHSSLKLILEIKWKRMETPFCKEGFYSSFFCQNVASRYTAAGIKWTPLVPQTFCKHFTVQMNEVLWRRKRGKCYREAFHLCQVSEKCLFVEKRESSPTTQL